ncbi:MAG: VOC family protein [Oscillospiraceae bacterium]|nr:VOC family protein [Oscillospiraceae bacterium]
MMVVIPTLHCGGRCEEAINLYKKAFGLVVDWQGKDENTGLIYHTEARIGDQRIRLSDGAEGEQIQVDSLFLTVVFDTVEEVEKTFGILKENGLIEIMPHKPEFATCWSMLKDKFGVKWSLMVD